MRKRFCLLPALALALLCACSKGAVNFVSVVSFYQCRKP